MRVTFLQDASPSRAESAFGVPWIPMTRLSYPSS